MNSALFVVVLITGITLVAAALWIAGLISPRFFQSTERRGLRMWYPYARGIMDAI